MPSFLSDLSHIVKVVSKHIFPIVDNGKDHKSGCTREHDLRFDKDWGYIIKKNKTKVYKMQQASKVPPEHIFNYHDKSSA